MPQRAGKWALVHRFEPRHEQQIAGGLARHGCHVIVHGRDTRHVQNTLALLAAEHPRVRAVAGDPGREGVQSIITGVQDGPCSIDILSNNAVIQNPWKPIWDMTKDEWLPSLPSNLFATVARWTAFAPGMKQRKYGQIINLTSGVKDTPRPEG